MSKADYKLLMLALKVASMIAVKNTDPSRLTLPSLLGLIERIQKGKGSIGGLHLIAKGEEAPTE